MSNYSKPKCNPHDPCKAQLYKTEKYQYYRYPVKYICTPVEWDTKCEKHVYWEPQKPYPPVKVSCEELRQKYDKDEMYYSKEQESYQAPEYGYEQDGYTPENQDGEEDGGYQEFGYSCK